MIRHFLAAASLAAIAAPLAAHDTTADRAALERDVRILSDDNMEGREAGTRGYAAAAGYVAGRFAALGLVPAGDNGTYFQEVPLTSATDDVDALKLTLTRPDGSTIPVNAMVDYYGGGYFREQQGVIDAPMVFIGHGIDLPEQGRDDFAGVDLTGKFAVRVSGIPGFLNPEEAAHMRSTVKDRMAEHGAIGSVLLWTPIVEKIIPWERSLSGGTDARMTWASPDGVPYQSDGLTAGFVLSPEISRAVLEGEAYDYDAVVAEEVSEAPDFPSFELQTRARLEFATNFETITSNNVVAILPGSDPALADQYIVLTAHLDHEGMKPTPEEGDDEIYNGAMDNATGIALMIEVARLLKGHPPRRPVMFVAVTAEEKGLIGSAYNAINPTVPREHIAANLNLDMPIVTYPFTDLNAFGVERSNMFAHVKEAVESAGLTLTPDPDPTQGLFVRSDQYSYIKQGVPAVYLKTGFGNGGEEAQAIFRKNHYHQVSDEADLIDFDSLSRFAEVNYAIADAIANMDERPAWLPGDFFGTSFGGPIAGAE